MEIFQKAAQSQWKRIANLVKDAVVFIDNYSAECLHWCGGADLLFKNGACCVKEFSSFESGSPTQTKAVFILTSILVGETESILQDIVKSSRFSECILISGLDSQVHSYASSEEVSRDGFLEDFSSKLSSWTTHKDCYVEAIHLPIFMAPIAENAFVTPAFDTIFPVQEKDLGNLELPDEVHHPTSLEDLHFYMFPKEYRVLLRMVASSFRSFFHNLRCKEEIFALGSTSKLLSIQLSNISNHSKDSYPNKIGVLFVDRTLDLMSAISHSDRTLVDQLLGILPGLPCHYNNVSVDMSLLCSTQCEKLDELIYSGCLEPDIKQRTILSSSISKESPEAIQVVMETLLTALADEGIDDLNLDKSSPSKSIKKMAQAFQGNPGGILYNSALLQFGLAVAQLLDDPTLNVWKKMATEEKLILQQLEVKEDVVERLKRITESDDISFQDFCSLLIYASFALRQNIDSNSYDMLSKTIQKLLQAADFSTQSESFISAFGLDENNWNATQRLPDIAAAILETIKQLKVNTLRDLKTLKLGAIEPPSHQSLLPQVVEKIFDTKKPELQPDIEHIATGRKDLLKMGMSMFRKITPPRPNDFPVLLIYVVGGISTSEVAQMNKVLEKYPYSSCQVVMGSNRIISPSDAVDCVLFDNNLHPDVNI